MTLRTKLIWIFIIGLGFFVAKYTQPTNSAPLRQAAKEEILETAAPPEADSPAGQEAGQFNATAHLYADEFTSTI
jgi:hypothetical protein